MQKRKKALAVVAGPYRLLQVLWLTLKYKEYDWSVVLLRYGENLSVVENLKKACLDSGVFQNVYTAITVGRYSTSIQKIRETLKMFFYYLIGKRKTYCLKLITNYISNFDYQLLCVAGSYSFFEGAVLNFSSDIETLIIQEGLPDYIKTTTNYNKITDLASNFLYKMGYINLKANPDFGFYNTCTKYAALPDKLRYKGFKKTEYMFDNSLIDKNTFRTLIQKFFPVEAETYDAVLFTAPLQLYSKNDFSELIQWLEKNYKNKRILIKKHPQDTADYYCENVKIFNKYTEFPGEVLLQCVSKCRLYFLFPSNMLIDIVRNPEVDYYVIHFTGLDAAYEKNFKRAVEFLEISSQKIIELK